MTMLLQLIKRFLVFLLLILLLQGCQLFQFHPPETSKESRSEDIQKLYSDVIKKLPNIDHGNSQAPELLNQAWALVGEWTEVYMNNHPNASPEDIAANFQKLNIPQNENYELYGDVIQLSPKAYAVSVHYPTVGTFFVVSKNNNGEYKIAWDIKKVATAHYSSGDEIGRWAYLSSMCYGNGPLVGWVHSLPESKNHNPRFYVEATTTGQGGTIPGQISVWEWNGEEAIPLIIGMYEYHVDGNPKTEFDGQFLKVHTTEHLKTFFSCGMCPDPEGIWIIRITPEGIEDLGRNDVVPELRMVDDLWYRMTNDLPVDDFASKQVISEIKRMIAYVKSESTKPDGYKTLSMLGGWKVIKKKDYNIMYWTVPSS